MPPRLPKPLRRTLLALACGFALGACGQRGPLYLPPPAAAAAPSAPAADTSSPTDSKKTTPSLSP